MARLALLADEHVDRAYVHGLRESGFVVERIGNEHSAGIDDDSILDVGQNRGLVIVTNDRDFVRLDRERTHAGIVLYTDQGIPTEDFVAGIRRIDGHFSPDTVAGELLWLDQWVDG